MSAPSLLAAPYAPPALRRGDRTTCLYRDAEVIITTMHDGRIPWPRCRVVDGNGSGSGLLVNETLLRAIRTESAAALMHWFGVGSNAVWRWRRSFVEGEGKFRTPGSRKAHLRASRAGVAGVAAKDWSDKELDRKAETAKRIGSRPPQRWTPRNGGWKVKELKLLHRLSDAEVAARIGRTEAAVRAKRRRIAKAD